ncbi:MAG: glycosyltransferase family 1 protein [Pseudomonadota bacterium]
MAEGARPAGILIDISRTLSRLGAGEPTGVDRVERAYIDWALARPEPCHFLARVPGGHILLDAEGMTALLQGPLAHDIFSRVAPWRDPGRRRAEATGRRRARAWLPGNRLRGLSRHLPAGCIALNVGHSNQRAEVYGALRTAGASQVVTLIHDVIPLDYPEYTRPDTVARFARNLRAAGEGSDLLIYNSDYTAERTAARLRAWGIERMGVTAHLGLTPAPPIARAAGEAAEFVMLGTIEPRKNHLLPLSIWRQFHDAPPPLPPHLHIIGRVGWENEQVLDILSRAPFMGQTVFQHGFLDDAALTHRLARARALLFPSFVEGFGLPLLEARALGLPVLASDIPPFREIADGHVTLLDPTDGPAWKRAILDLTTGSVHGEQRGTGMAELPSWDAHFAQIVAALGLDTK